jgi:hypothetical protein
MPGQLLPRREIQVTGGDDSVGVHIGAVFPDFAFEHQMVLSLLQLFSVIVQSIVP